MSRSRDILYGIVIGGLLTVFVLVMLANRQGGIVKDLIDRLTQDVTVIDLYEYPPQGAQVANIQRLNTDVDEHEEWVVTYQYDMAARNNPVSCVIYDAEGDGLYLFYPHALRTPAGDFLGEGSVNVSLADMLSDPGGASQARSEIIVSSGTTLSIFRVLEVAQSAPPDYANPYHCEGFFKGTLKVQVDGNRVSVWDRAGNDRSQLALRRVYLPNNGSYFRPGTTELVAPAEASITFAYGMPDDIQNTPYPEKLVLAFYDNLDEGGVSGYLTAQAQTRFNAGQLEYGSPWRGASLQRVLVQEISYVPGDELVASVADGNPNTPTSQVQVKALFIGPGGERRLRQITWLLLKQGNQWKMHDASAADL